MSCRAVGEHDAVQDDPENVVHRGLVDCERDVAQDAGDEEKNHEFVCELRQREWCTMASRHSARRDGNRPQGRREQQLARTRRRNLKSSGSSLGGDMAFFPNSVSRLAASSEERPFDFSGASTLIEVRSFTASSSRVSRCSSQLRAGIAARWEGPKVDCSPQDDCLPTNMCTRMGLKERTCIP